MFLDAREIPSGTSLEVPVCIAGAGAAGITLACRLANAGIGVVLLESGGYALDAENQALYRGKNVGEPYFPLTLGRLRYLGGTTNHWTGWCRPLDAFDFEQRAWIKDSGWPLEHEELVPHLRLAQQSCELGPLEYSPSYWSAITGQELLPLNDELVETAIWQFSPPTRFAQRYDQELSRLANLAVYLNANVVDVETAARGARVERVRVATLDKKSFYVHPGALVLALGAIENARVLLACDGGQPGGLGNRYDNVGRYFMEHPHATVGVALSTLGSTQTRLYDGVIDIQTRAPPAVRAALCLPPDRVRREKLVGFSLTLEPHVAFPSFGRAMQAGVQQLVSDMQRVTASREQQLFIRTEQAPNRESRVRLGQERDALGMRRVELEWKLDALTRRTMRRGIELVASAFGRARLGRLYSFCHSNDEYRPGCWPDIMGGHHHMGTTRMGDDPTTSVVDRDCRVHGMENLYVAGSSVFPTSGFANPTLTLVALAHRLADHLKGAEL